MTPTRQAVRCGPVMRDRAEERGAGPAAPPGVGGGSTEDVTLYKKLCAVLKCDTLCYKGDTLHGKACHGAPTV